MKERLGIWHGVAYPGQSGTETAQFGRVGVKYGSGARNKAILMRCLVIDDSPTIQFLLRHILASHGDCDVAQNGQEALDAHNRSLEDGRPYDLICLDLGLPYLNGEEVLAKIRAAEAQRQLPVRARIIVITASHDAGEVQRICDQGADGHLLKPVDARALTEYLENFGLVGGTAKEEPRPIKEVERMGDEDEIPIPVLAALIRCLVDSLSRQSSGAANPHK